MYRRNLRIRHCLRLCAILLAAAVLQLIFQSQPVKNWTSEVFSAPALTSWALYLQTGVAVKPDAEHTSAQTTLQTPSEEPTSENDAASSASETPESAEQSQPQEPQTQATPDSGAQAPADSATEPLTFSAEEAQNIEIAGGCTYEVDKAALLQQPLDLEFTADAPSVLIVHTHTTEAYTMETGMEYDAMTHARTLDEQYNVVRVGEEIAEVLRSYGIGVIHDTTVNDYPSYNGAYDRMKTIIESDLAQYPSIQMVLDIHRDAAVDENGDPLALTTTFNEEEYAQIMLVVGTDEGGLSHPLWQQNLSCALKLQALLNRDWDGLCRKLDLRQERFNQNQTPGSLLVEFGTDGNTLSQVLRSADAFGHTLAQLILSETTA